MPISTSRRFLIVHGALRLATAALALLTMAEALSAQCALQAGPARAVTQVLDAETLRLDDGSEVRLAGILAPGAPDAASDTTFWPPAQEAKAALEALVAGQSVEIASLESRGDRYGRLVAHVFVARDRRRIWVQGALLATGHARVQALGGGTTCLDELMGHERVAFHAHRGLWSNAAYQVRSATETFELMRYRHTFQLIEGEIAEVADVKGRVYLNFGADWRSDFTAGIDKARGPGWPADFKALKGERVRVRGYIERRNGPYIELAHPSQLEVLRQEPEAAPQTRRSRRKKVAPEATGDQ